MNYRAGRKEIVNTHEPATRSQLDARQASADVQAEGAEEREHHGPEREDPVAEDQGGPRTSSCERTGMPLVLGRGAGCSSRGGMKAGAVPLV
jgi:hypothetical protein